MKEILIRLFLCFGAGALSSFAMSPFNAWAVLFFTLGAFYALLAQTDSNKQAFFLGWAFGFGYFLFGLSWIGNALLVEGNDFAWAWPLAVSGLPFLLAFFYGAASFVAAKFSDLKTIFGYFFFAAAFIFFEFLRGHIFTGFPWNLFGYSWVNTLPVIQITALGSIYTLTWLSIIWFSIGGFLYVYKSAFRAKLFLTLILTTSFVSVYAYGAVRISSYVPQYYESSVIKIIQPNIAQHEKWDRSKMNENFFKLLRLSYPDTLSQQPVLIVWPETALSYIYTQDDTSMSLITQMLKSYDAGAHLITGMLRKNTEGGFSNSIVMIDHEGVINNVYDKHHLVPFGEYIPFQSLIPLKPVVEFSGFKTGAGPTKMHTLHGLSYSPLVCYEAIFPGKAVEDGKDRPDFILNTTNDAWYGDSAGPYQHLTQTIFRAVEEGVPLVRSANTGISAMVSPTGEILHKDALFEVNNEALKLPQKIIKQPVSGFYKNATMFLTVLLSLILAFMCRKSIHSKP